jgi:hypothetical protein
MFWAEATVVVMVRERFFSKKGQKRGFFLGALRGRSAKNSMKIGLFREIRNGFVFHPGLILTTDGN